jgi:hypothetical protein
MAFYGRIDNLVISHYFKGFWDNVNNHRPFLQKLMLSGNIETGISGKNLVWTARAGRHTEQAYDELESIDITRKNQYIQANLPWAFLTMSDAISREEIRMSSGEFAMVRHNKELLGNLTQDFEKRLNYQMLNYDGADYSSNIIYGLPTALNVATYAAGSALATNSGTYAGQSTAASGITGIDGVEADAWQPKIVNYTSTALTATGAAATWANDCLRALTYAKDQVTFGTMAEEQPDLVIITRAMMSKLKAAITLQQRMVITNAPDAAEKGLGIPGAVQHDGLEIAFDTDQPTDWFYMVNSKKTYLEMLPKVDEGGGSSLIGGKKGKSAEYFEVVTQDDIRTNGLAVRVNWAGQLRFNPKYLAAGYPFA